MTTEEFVTKMLITLLVVLLVGGFHLMSLMLLRFVRGEPWLTTQEKQWWRIAGLVMLTVLVGCFGFLIYLQRLLV
jgi:preprotein translocase subunit Sss1